MAANSRLIGLVRLIRLVGLIGLIGLAALPAAAQVRLADESDRAAFRGWFVLLADAAFYRTPAEVTDCSSLVRYAFREALELVDGRGAEQQRLAGEVVEAHGRSIFAWTERSRGDDPISSVRGGARLARPRGLWR